MKAINNLFKSLVLILVSISFFACSSDDGVIKDEQGQIELTTDNLTSKWTQRYNYTRNTGTKTFDLANGVRSNDLLQVKPYQGVQFSKTDNFCNINLPVINENNKVDMMPFNGKWRIDSNNTITIYNLTNNYNDVVLTNVKLEREGNRDNEVMKISYNFNSVVLNDQITIVGDSKETL